MLNDDNDKYKMCPCFRHLITRDPQIGDYIITFSGIQVIINIFFDEESEEKYFKTYRIPQNVSFYSSAYYGAYLETFNFKNNDFLIIDKEFAEILLKKVRMFSLFYLVSCTV